MREQDAVDVLELLIAATTNYPISSEKRELFLSQLLPLDGDLATKAVLAGMREWENFPVWGQYYEAYRAQRDARIREEAIAENAESTKRGAKAPDWVYVWWWCRNARDPREERRFPQQSQDPEALTTEEYKTLHGEWEAAGSPRPRDLLVVF